MTNGAKTGLTGRTWAGIWTAILAGATAAGGVQIYVAGGGPGEGQAAAAGDHDTVVALVELAKSHEQQIQANRDNITALTAMLRENQTALTQQIDRLSQRIDRVLEQRSQP